MQAWLWWKAEAERCEKTAYEIILAYRDRYPADGVTADRRRREDDGFKQAVSNQQFAVQQAGLYADAVQIHLLTAILTATRQTSP